MKILSRLILLLTVAVTLTLTSCNKDNAKKVFTDIGTLTLTSNSATLVTDSGYTLNGVVSLASEYNGTRAVATYSLVNSELEGNPPKVVDVEFYTIEPVTISHLKYSSYFSNPDDIVKTLGKMNISPVEIYGYWFSGGYLNMVTSFRTLSENSKYTITMLVDEQKSTNETIYATLHLKTDLASDGREGAHVMSRRVSFDMSKYTNAGKKFVLNLTYSPYPNDSSTQTTEYSFAN